MKKGNIPVTVDEYINSAPKQAQSLLKQMRKIIRAEAPHAEESINYGMPGYKYLGRPLIYFAAYENHIGFYATPTGHEAFKKELSVYKTGKGSVQFPLNEKLPVALIKKIVWFRLKENEEKTGKKKKPVTVVAVKSKQSGPSDEDEVKSWLDKLDTATRKQIDSVRKIIKAAAPQLNERIKWNAPSYYYKEDIVTFGPLRKKDQILLVFHHPDIVKIKSALLEGNYKDRRLVYFNSPAEIAAGEKELARIIKEMVKMIK